VDTTRNISTMHGNNTEQIGCGGGRKERECGGDWNVPGNGKGQLITMGDQKGEGEMKAQEHKGRGKCKGTHHMDKSVKKKEKNEGLTGG